MSRDPIGSNKIHLSGKSLNMEAHEVSVFRGGKKTKKTKKLLYLAKYACKFRPDQKDQNFGSPFPPFFIIF